ncbi:MAG: methyl-accepting chemotaxis protein [Desulfovibrionaceae bacterium]
MTSSRLRLSIFITSVNSILFCVFIYFAYTLLTNSIINAPQAKNTVTIFPTIGCFSLLFFMCLLISNLLIIYFTLEDLGKLHIYFKKILLGEKLSPLYLRENSDLQEIAMVGFTLSEIPNNTTKDDENGVKDLEKYSKILENSLSESEQEKQDILAYGISLKTSLIADLEKISDNISVVFSVLNEHVEEAHTGALEQKERVSEASSSMEEMNISVSDVAKNASQAANSAATAKKNAEEGFIIVGSVIDSIKIVRTTTKNLTDSLNILADHTRNIGQILTVINDIADQTNLLALNAAIEAARAGESGRGFAVVADEVRKLAEKTMIATKEVDSAITQIQEGTTKSIDNMEKATSSIDETSILANKAGDALNSIVGIVENTADQVNSIATASEEQSIASEQIRKRSNEIDQIAGKTLETMNISKEKLTDADTAIQELTTITESLKENKFLESSKISIPSTLQINNNHISQ